MYLSYFGLTETPFAITPDPRFVFLSKRHEDALAHLRYGITQGGGGGFVQLTGEVGTGKTTLSRCLLNELPEHVRAALILNPILDPLELLEAICEELKVPIRGAHGSQKKLVDRLNRYLLQAHGEGMTVVLVLDEAQNLSPAALEQVRLLTNLETPTQKLLQVVLLGQPELRDLLRRPDLRQLAQRITARYHLVPLDECETAAYTAHRLRVAGAQGEVFTRAGMRALHRASGGVPRLINIIAERSLLAAYARGRRTIGAGLVRAAAAEVHDPEAGRERARRWPVAAVLAAGLALAGWYGYSHWAPDLPAAGLEPPPAASAAAVDTAAAPIATPPPPAPEPTLAAVGFAAAWDRLLAARGIPPRPAPALPGCGDAESGGDSVRCLEGRTTAAELIELQRPVIAELSALEDRYVVVQLTSATALLDAGDDVPRPVFERHWSGRYWDLWRMPNYVPELLREGDRGPGVLWVKEVAARAEPAFVADTMDPYFGPSLRSWALDFQRRAGLREDGIIGPETLRLLSRFARLPDA